MQLYKKKQRAFTMIELLVVTTIIIVLSTIGLVSYRQVGVSSRDSKRKADLEIMRQALILYKQDKGYYASTTPISFSTLKTNLAAGNYISEAAAIEDPKNVTPYIYTASCTVVAAPNCLSVRLSAVLESDGTTYTINAL